MQKKVFIVILNWNGAKDTIECIESLNGIDYDNFQTVIVDNGSIDDSLQVLKKKFSKSTYIESKTNRGYAGGNNLGIDYALRNGADYVLLLNNDTTVEKDFLKKLVEAGEQDKSIGILGPKICFWSNPETIWFAGGMINWMKTSGIHIGLGEAEKGKRDAIKEVDFLTGCSLLVKKAVFEKIGKLSEDYFLYYEDTDFCCRARKAGYKCLYVPLSKIYHKVSRSTEPGSRSYVYYHTRNGLMLSKRNGSFLNKALLYPYCILLFLKQIVKIVFMPDKREWAWAVMQGEKDFLAGKTGKNEQ